MSLSLELNSSLYLPNLSSTNAFIDDIAPNKPPPFTTVVVAFLFIVYWQDNQKVLTFWIEGWND